MKFLILVIAVLIQSRKPVITWSLPTGWFTAWQNKVAAFPSGSPCSDTRQYILVVGLPVLACAVLFGLLDGWFWGLISLVLEVVLVSILIRPALSWLALSAYREHLDHGDLQGAFYCAQDYAGDDRSLENHECMNEGVINVLLRRWFEHFFLVIFWYAILDVAGLALVWLTSLYCLQFEAVSGNEDEGKSSYGSTGNAFLHWLGWVPARLVALTYCLIGNFSTGFAAWKVSASKTRIANTELLMAVAESALHGETGGSDIRATSDREGAVKRLTAWHSIQMTSALGWLAALGIASIAGWVL